MRETMWDSIGAMFALTNIPLYPHVTEATTQRAENIDLCGLIHQGLPFSAQKFTCRAE
jgi:hypothetical protein